MSASHVSSGRTDSTASWLEPESNHTSRIFISRSKLAPPHEPQVSPSGPNSWGGRSYQASAPNRSNTDAALSTIADEITASPQLVQSSAGIGTPHARCRDTHQSGLFATML